jgi:hypothetical protein
LAPGDLLSAVMGGPASSSSSSSEEEDANWKAAIESIAATTTFANKVLSSTSNGSTSRSAPTTEAYAENSQDSRKLKHYQIKATLSFLFLFMVYLPHCLQLKKIRLLFLFGFLASCFSFSFLF